MTYPISYTLDRLLNYLKTGTASQSAVVQPSAVSLEEAGSYLGAAEAHPGFVQFATDVEVAAGTVETKVPSVAQVAGALSGMIASDADVETGTSTAKVPNVAQVSGLLSRLKLISFTGAAAAGPCTATGLVVGDVVLSVSGIPDDGNFSDDFEATITVDDQIQQLSASDLSTKRFMALILQAPEEA